MIRHMLLFALAGLLLVSGCGGPDAEKAREELASLDKLLDEYAAIIDRHDEQVRAAAESGDAAALRTAQEAMFTDLQDWMGRWTVQIQQPENLSAEDLQPLLARSQEIRARVEPLLNMTVAGDDAEVDAGAGDAAPPATMPAGPEAQLAALQALLDEYEQIIETHGGKIREAAAAGEAELVQARRDELHAKQQQWAERWQQQIAHAGQLDREAVSLLAARAQALRRRLEQALTGQAGAQDE